MEKVAKKMNLGRFSRQKDQNLNERLFDNP